MSSIIKLLPDSIANQIAAGEVIQRPASAVKELLENAIDSGSTSIKLIIKDAGKTLIQVIDNGCGMSPVDAELCFSRHATSKIRKIEDLSEVRTMGFRGEALSSIASIAQVDLKTRPKGEELGSLISVAGSKSKPTEACSCPEGTTISVKNLFFNVPARRNFLKTNSVETKHIIDEFQRVALANPGLHMEFIHNGVQIYHLKEGNLRQRLVQVFGKNYNERLIPIQEKTDIISINGFVGKPEFSKKTRGEQFFFVNGRFIKSPYLNHAVIQSFENIISKGQYPFYCICLDVDPAKIDVNVHPTKQEIKFEDDKVIYTILGAVIKSSLGKYNISPSLDFESSNNFDHFFSEPKPSFKNPGYITKRSKMDHYSGPATKTKIDGWDELLSIQKESVEFEHTEDILSPGLIPEWDNEDINNSDQQWIQIHGRYIISSIKSGLILVNQKLAHERIKYEYYLEVLSKKKNTSQQLLFPIEAECPTADLSLMESLKDSFSALGFEIEHLKDNIFTINGVPSDLLGKEDPKVIESLLEEFKACEGGPQNTDQNALALSLARYSCIKEGKRLVGDEMRALIDQLFACSQPNFAPDGRPVFVSISLDQINDLFQK